MSDSLAELVAERAIRRLISAYCDAVNRRDAEAAGRLFAPDCRVFIAGGPEIAGRAAQTEGMRATFAAFSFIFQKCDLGLIDIGPDGVSAKARLGVFEASRRAGDERLSLIFGHYEDEYALLDDGWRFARRRYSMRLRGLFAAEKIQEMGDLVPEFAFPA